MKRLLVLIITGCFALMWGWMIIGGGSQVWEGLASRTWPSVTGEMISSTAVAAGGRSPGKYSLEVAYRYRVDGVAHESRRVRAVGHSSKKEAIEAEVNRLTPGSVVTVYYNPQRPSQAYLETGVSVMEGLLPFFGVLGFALSLVAFVGALRWKGDMAGHKNSRPSRYVLPGE